MYSGWLGLVSSPLSTPRRLKWSAKQNAQTDKEKEEEEEVDGQTDKWALLQKLWWPEVAVFTLFFSTLALWPPLITEIKSFDFPHLQAMDNSNYINNEILIEIGQWYALWAATFKTTGKLLN